MIAFDTNVLLYTLDDSAPAKQKVASELVARTVNGVLLWQVACEFIGASRKLAAGGLTPHKAWEELELFQNGMRFALPTPTVLHLARVLHVEQRVSFWDSM